ncbi:YheC/YheD family protein [Paenibacillus apiarius]|uniref:YheC/YheD family protein n=1 Tax=Paenibacillus apiarius TaxID=46240 RepID=A0ABT4DS18_9BACL|nr:YheC/YheD family protein [Paenibacillus apiarius]MCY9514341.1 YheC/YheD family protein [Paenibacillus apiarius]MCY9520076.1 YheC/YheD family protein [Paenibacillus apiarius]MCY9550082.1 YheC/YheD family protein [Paenibacillus apiarius]MCY9560306.1 YheC/YheD family protein [Paenibacillus apiarius]MCY9683203.1 YheC/YheD family protein [Paenibacillus apiarius]
MNKRTADVPAQPRVPAKGPKWDHYVELKKDHDISVHLPYTMKLNKASLHSMLSLFPSVYVKPNRGAFGVGVMQVDSKGSNNQPLFRVHKGTRQETFNSEKQLYSYVLANQVNKNYIVQQGINLLQWNRRPFDIRMMIKKQSEGTWKNEGFLGRVAQPDKIVTNIRSGGTPMPIEDLLAPYTSPFGIQYTKEALNRLGAHICKRLEKKYEGIQLLGIDIGMDQQVKPWIIEVNMRPEKICWDCIRKLYNRLGPA